MYFMQLNDGCEDLEDIEIRSLNELHCMATCDCAYDEEDEDCDEMSPSEILQNWYPLASNVVYSDDKAILKVLRKIYPQFGKDCDATRELFVSIILNYITEEDLEKELKRRKAN